MPVQILRDFKLPEGSSGDDVDANGDGEVLAVLDLGTDDSLVEAGLAREVVNRVQKLRKKAGLVASDVVDVFVDAQQHSDGACLEVGCVCSFVLQLIPNKPISAIAKE